MFDDCAIGDAVLDEEAYELNVKIISKNIDEIEELLQALEDLGVIGF